MLSNALLTEFLYIMLEKILCERTVHEAKHGRPNKDENLDSLKKGLQLMHYRLNNYEQIFRVMNMITDEMISRNKNKLDNLYMAS